MAGTKLIEELKKEIERYLGIPYARNQWSEDNILVQEAVFGGKGGVEDIEYATKCAAEREGLKWENLSEEEIYLLRKRNKIGIDCSGFVYRLLDKIDQLKGNSGILFKVLGVDRPYGVMGVRALSAREIAHEQNSVPVEDIKNIETGDVIRMDGGSHIMLIVENNGKEIVYVHSKGSETQGIQYQKIVITDQNRSIKEQDWQEKQQNGESYGNLLFPENGDGVFRLRIWTDNMPSKIEVNKVERMVADSGK